MGPGGFSMGFDGDVPHFDNRAHTQTHSELERKFAKARRKRARAQFEEDARAGSGGSVWLQFFIVTGVIGAVFTIPTLLYNGGARPVRRREQVDSA